MNTPSAIEPPHIERRDPTPPAIGPDAPATKSYWWVWLIIIAALGYGGYRLYQIQQVNKATAAAKKEKRGPRSIPVVTAAVRSGDMPIYLRGLGAASAFNTVTVKARVDGQLISVNFKEGQFVNQGDVLAEIDPRPFQVALDQATGNLNKDEAALKDAQVNLARDQELFNDKIIAKQQLDTQGATVNGSEGSIAADQAAINSAKLQLSFTKILAPISGRIGLRQVDAGNMVHAADANGIAVITQLHPIAVLFSLPEDDLQQVLKKLNAGAKLPADAYDRNETTKIASGTLETVDNEIDQTTGTSKLKAIFPNTNNALFPNQFVNVRLLLDVQHGVVIAPAVAVQRGPAGTFVYLVKADHTVTVRPVKLGQTEGNDVTIADGLSQNEQVVVDGADKLTEGMQVTTRDSGSGASRRRSAE